MTDWFSQATIFVQQGDMESERLQLINFLKGSLCQVEVVLNPSDQIRSFNPFDTYPILTDHGLSLTGRSRLDAFFEERYPGVPLLPHGAMERAIVRTIADDITSAYDTINTNPDYTISKIREFVLAFPPDHRWFCGPSLNLVDCAIAPLLTRLPQLNIAFEPYSHSYNYSKRITELLEKALMPSSPRIDADDNEGFDLDDTIAA